MLRVLVTLALLALAGPAFAQGQAVLGCIPPTKFTDGSNITGTITYKFYEGPSANTQTAASPVQTACAYAWPGLSVGTHFFSATATVAGIESARTNVVSKVVPPPAPNPPTNLTVAADLTAWTLAPSTNKVAFIAVGKFSAGTTCDPAQPVLDKFVVVVDAAHPVILPPGKTTTAVTFLGSCG